MTTPDLVAAARGTARPITSSPPPVAITPRLLDVEEVALYCGCSRRQIRYLISRGLLHPVRLDRRVRLDRTEVDRLIERAMQRDLRAPSGVRA